MSLTLLLLFCFATIGLTYIIGHGNIFELLGRRWLGQGVRPWLREKMGDWGEVLECHQCLGFWCGLIVGCFLCALLHNWWLLLPLGWAGSALVPIYDDLSNYINSKIEFVVRDETEQ